MGTPHLNCKDFSSLIIDDYSFLALWFTFLIDHHGEMPFLFPCLHISDVNETRAFPMIKNFEPHLSDMELDAQEFMTKCYIWEGTEFPVVECYFSS